MPTQKNRSTGRKSSDASPTKMWDKKSVQEFDGRKRMRDPDESDENGKWNKLGKSRPAVIVSKWHVRTPGKVD